MKLQIDKDTKVKDVQKKFAEEYPYLKIEFYKKPHSKTELSRIKDRISPNEIISEVSNFRGKKSIDINQERTVADLEAAVYKKLGIGMQVSRRTGNIWIETSLSDSRTLGMQNEQGKMSVPAIESDLVKQIIGS